VLDAEEEKVPARQLEHAVAEDTEYVPATHTDAADNPVVAQYEPAVHEVHDVEPIDA